MGFQATIDEGQGKLLILKKGKLLGYYSLAFLKQKAIEKIGNGLILVRAETKIKADTSIFTTKTHISLKKLIRLNFLPIQNTIFVLVSIIVE